MTLQEKTNSDRPIQFGRRRYTVAQVAADLGYSTRHFRVLYRTGKIPRPTSLIPGGKQTYAEDAYRRILSTMDRGT